MITTRKMLGLGAGLLGLLILAFGLPAAPAVAEDAESAGQEAFVANKCNMCHSVESLGIERTSTSDKMMAADLSTAGDDLDIEWAVQFIKKEADLEGELHKKAFKGTDEEAQQIAEFLATLTSPAE